MSVTVVVSSFGSFVCLVVLKVCGVPHSVHHVDGSLVSLSLSCSESVLNVPLLLVGDVVRVVACVFCVLYR